MLHESVSHQTVYCVRMRTERRDGGRSRGDADEASRSPRDSRRSRSRRGDDRRFTIDELARRAGMTVRNVRAHQSRGLLPPPELRGRTGYYGADHVARLELIKDLQAEGFTLESIKRILQRAPEGAVGEVLDFTRAAASAFADEQPIVVDARVMAERWGDQLTPEVVTRIERLGFARPLGGGHYEMVSPSLERASKELAELGVPLEVAVDIIATLRKHSEAVAKAYVKLFLEHVVEPTEEQGEGPERWAELSAALERLRPLATKSLVAAFQVVMTEQVERALERELARLGRD
jgi:DNA-binding transcriptional MerR regulator